MTLAKISPARLAAFRVLRKVAEDNGFSAILLPAAEAELQPEDRALCHEIVLGVLRNQTLLDRLIANFSGKKIEKLDLPVLLALRIGIYQLRFLTKIPARAAVNESVNLVYFAKLRSAANFVNAVLRNATRSADFDPLAAIENPLERLSVETSHPVWLLEKWIRDFGFERAAELARINNRAAPTVFRLTDLTDESVLDELRNHDAKLTESTVAPGAWQIENANSKLREFVAAGKIYVQDAASQLVAHVCALNSHENFIDVCAAPGSKTTLIASLKAQTANSEFPIEHSDLQNPKSKIQNLKSLSVAGDFSVPRIRILRETIQKFAGGKVKIVRYDATADLPFADTSFDCVLVDAPCSGTGTIRHNPEIRWHLRETDFAELAAKQLRILTNAARLVKGGGRLIYSTCSLEPEEDEAVIEKFLIENPEFVKADLNLPENLLTAQSFGRTFPPRDDADGFFISALIRRI